MVRRGDFQVIQSILQAVSARETREGWPMQTVETVEGGLFHYSDSYWTQKRLLQYQTNIAIGLQLSD
jgi:hypothetical protein